MAQTFTVNSVGRLSPLGIQKAPNDIVSVAVDFGLFFGSGTGSTATVTADAGITAGSPTVSSNVVTFALSGGDAGYGYDVTCKLAGSSETKEVTFLARVFDPEHYATDDYGVCG